MILRRFIDHVKTQNWTAVALDFVIVVFGVFIGIQVSNWNDARAERRSEASIIQRLHTEVAAVEAAYETDRTRERIIRERLYGIRKILLGMEDVRPLTFEECRSIGNSHAPFIPNLDVPVVQEMLSTGQLSVIRSDALRNAVSALHRANQIRMLDVDTYTRRGAYLPRDFPALLPYHLEPADDPNDEDGYTPGYLCDTAAMKADPEFVNNFGENVSHYATAGNIIRRNAPVLSALHAAVDVELGVTHAVQETAQ